MSEKEAEAQLTLKDRLNFPYILANQILTFQKAILALDYSDREIEESIKGFIHLIPEAWKDDQFRKDLEDAKSMRQVDKRPMVRAGVRLDEATCKVLGIPAIVEEEAVDYYRVFQACIDLLCRRDMLGKIHRVEVLEGVDFDTVAIPAVLPSDVSSQ